MIVCPNCDHENPMGATLCETCYTPLPVTTNDNLDCPHCGAEILPHATFCGQCGSSLTPSTGGNSGNVKDEAELNPDVESYTHNTLTEEDDSENSMEVEELSANNLESEEKVISGKTQLQLQNATLFHIQTETTIPLVSELPVIHMGKPNDRVPPDIDVSGFPDSQIVSRIHADIRREEDAFYLEDTGSANGTYINHIPLPTGNRHRLNNGDRIALGKEDKVSFIFQLNDNNGE
jgi:pSer/pThr/pTyr-binding forkhead associated (FHA) protein